MCARRQTVAAYYAFGLYWGTPQAQNAKGHVVGHIKVCGCVCVLGGGGLVQLFALGTDVSTPAHPPTAHTNSTHSLL